jgi:hypothetical protein
MVHLGVASGSGGQVRPAATPAHQEREPGAFLAAGVPSDPCANLNTITNTYPNTKFSSTLTLSPNLEPKLSLPQVLVMALRARRDFVTSKGLWLRRQQEPGCVEFFEVEGAVHDRRVGTGCVCSVLSVFAGASAPAGSGDSRPPYHP